MGKLAKKHLTDTMDRLTKAGSAHIVTSLSQTVPKIVDIMTSCNEKCTGHQPAVDQIVKLCLDAGLAVKKNIHGRNCGIHPSSRAGTGVNPFNAQDLLLKISN